MSTLPSNIKRGSAELAILSLLAEEALHGYEIAKRIEKQTGGVLRFDVASLYPVLYGLERRGFVKGEWETAASGRERRYYRLTLEGRKKLKPLRQQWKEFFLALDQLAGVHGA
jgi:PadR family transcriptional regulator, regulatory protein PadR